MLVDETGDRSAPWGAYLFFVRWSAGQPQVAGHLESPFLVTGDNEALVRHKLGAMPLGTVKATLDGLIRTDAHAQRPSRPWWEVAASEQGAADDTPPDDTPPDDTSADRHGRAS